MKVLITGGAGYIGSHLADYFHNNGNSITVVDNLSTGNVTNIEHNLQSQNFSFVHGSILDRDLMKKLIGEHDLICHLAAVVGVKHVLKNPVRSIIDNASGTETVLTLAHQYKRRILFASTSEVYGKNPHVPFAEDHDSLFGSTKVFRWSYAISKALGEHLCFAYHGEGLPVSIVRYVNSYGPRLDPRGYGSVVASFITQALTGNPLTVHGDGQQTRCFTYVDDTVLGSFLASTKEEALGEVFNIGSSVDTSIAELATLILKLTDSRSSVNFIPYSDAYGTNFEDMTRVLNVSKAEKLLGFKALISLKEGLSRTIAWFRKQPLDNLALRY
jgi:UDP-glucose 4-epimerase